MKKSAADEVVGLFLFPFLIFIFHSVIVDLLFVSVRVISWIV